MMASMATVDRERVRLLDAGAGVGSLTAAWVAERCLWNRRPREVALTAFEIDKKLLPALEATLRECEQACKAVGVRCTWEIKDRDFIPAAVDLLDEGFFTSEGSSFDVAILNPPYKKVRTDSNTRATLRRVGIETSNLYSAFLALAVDLLEEGGELIAITPRSFCNGPYFLPFRERLLSRVALRRVHVFEARDIAFAEDTVLQENVIVHGVRGGGVPRTVTITSSEAASTGETTSREVPFSQVVRPGDAGRFIHIAPNDTVAELAESVAGLPCTLHELGIRVSTGRVVDFRARDWLRRESSDDTAPLIYPSHFLDGFVAWPKVESKKPNAIVANESSESLLVPSKVYVLVKRFSSKEERRRVVAAVYDPRRIKATFVGFENHLNYFYDPHRPLSMAIARGLAAFLNSTAVDVYFRQFNGHTQVNATDLRAIRYPRREVLGEIGRSLPETPLDQAGLDEVVTQAITAHMSAV